MREILFRGKQIGNGKWVEGWYARYPFTRWPLHDAIIPSEDAENGHFCPVEVDPATIGQYIGLKDKNGQRIFEGDILREQRLHFGDIFYIIEWGESSFGARSRRNGKTSDIVIPIDDSEYGFSTDNMEIVGNIYDNPELIKED